MAYTFLTEDCRQGKVFMQPQQTIKEIQANTEVIGIFLLGSSAQLQSRNGPFWKLELRDATGSIEAKIWSPLSLEFTELSSGSFIHIQGRTSLFRDQIQLSIDKMHLLDEESIAELDLSLFMPASPRPAEDMWEELLALCKKEFTHAPWRKLVMSVLKDKEISLAFKRAPAAKGVHHAYMGGLLEHTLSVMQVCLRLSDQYPDLDRQVVLAGALFHDMGKIWELSGGMVTDYTDEGRLLGHMELALEHLYPFMQKSGLEPELIRHLKHLILSHHGSYEFGSARLPQTPEAMLLHYADNIDAKMAQCRHIFADWEEEKSGWSAYQPTLERFMHKPYRTPTPAISPAAPQKKKVEAQCLSLLKV